MQVELNGVLYVVDIIKKNNNRGFTLVEQISLMSLRGKVTIVVLFATLVALIFTFTYIK